MCATEYESFDGAWCYGSYEGVLRRLIQVYKYERIESLAGPLGRLLSDALPRDESFDAIVPMPLHWFKNWQRGFNQSGLLAREVGRRSGIPIVSALNRRRATKVQAGLSLAGRKRNVQGAFAIRGGADAVRGRHLLLVDDVLTTGATANACARVLKRAGARRVSILTVARADRLSAWTPPPAAHIDSINRPGDSDR